MIGRRYCPLVNLMVSLQSFVEANECTATAIALLARAIDQAQPQASLVCAFYDADHDDQQLHAFLKSRFPFAALLGGTSCGGAMTEAGLGGRGSIGLLVLDDPDGDYGTAAVRLEGDIATCAERAIHIALDNAGCPGELPELVWVYQAPGDEEAVIEGLRRVVGDRCPIIGGSSADNTVQGAWRQLGPDGPLEKGVVVGVLFSSGGIGYAFQGGYEPTGVSGIVTRVGAAPSESPDTVASERSRHIVAIDGESAAVVYNRWLGGTLSEQVESGGSILADTTMHPLGVDVGRTDELTHYLLVHPAQVMTDGALATFAAVEEGTRVFGMRGDRERLVERAGRVATAATRTLGDGTSLAGGLIVYCAGCMLAVGEDMPQVASTVSKSLDGTPFVGCFTFGEQGVLLDRNVHGNLMISAVVFGQ